MPNKTRLASMTWKEAEEAFKENPVIIVPSASIEQHGPQTPVGDFRVGEVVADRIAERTSALVAPMLAYGYSEVFRRFPGTLTLRPSTVHSVMHDVVTCLLDQGLDHVMFLCCHNGNMPILDHVAREIRRERGVVLGCLEPWRLFSPSFFEDVYQQPSPRHGHGSEPFTSLSLHLFPEDVRMDLAEQEARADFGDLPLRGVNQIAVGDVQGHIYFDYLDVVPNGVMGDVSLGNAEAGARLLERVVELGVEYVEIFRGVDTRR
jgi:creatinine amidohydrolase